MSALAVALLSLVNATVAFAAWRITDSCAARRRFAAAPATRPPFDWPLAHRAGTRMLRGRRDRALEASLPDALDAMARALRSGGSLRQAIDEAAATAQGTLGDDLSRVSRSSASGVPLDGALEQWSTECPLPGVRLTAAALALGAETGGASAQAIDGVAATLRTNLAIAGEVRALSSQARLSALVIALSPIAFAVLATSTDARAARFLVATPVGLVCLAVGLGLDAIGWLWMRRLTVVVA